ncbi:MAG: hypothetical protein ONB14_09605, partial [candidate division KSB1 bacterium]|nr:hypothetical protein [candidate division KSB1 bacterium]
MLSNNLFQKVWVPYLLTMFAAGSGHSLSAPMPGWISTGPEGGFVFAIAVNRQNSNTVYAAVWTR